MIEGTLLLVDDDEFLRTRLARAFEARGLRVITAADFGESLGESLNHTVVFGALSGMRGVVWINECSMLQRAHG